MYIPPATSPQSQCWRIPCFQLLLIAMPYICYLRPSNGYSPYCITWGDETNRRATHEYQKQDCKMHVLPRRLCFVFVRWRTTGKMSAKTMMSRETARRFQGRERKVERREKKRKYSPQTAKHAQNTLRHAHTWQMIDRNVDLSSRTASSCFLWLSQARSPSLARVSASDRQLPQRTVR